eukprot:706214-Rhodomonas_salina.1
MTGQFGIGIATPRGEYQRYLLFCLCGSAVPCDIPGRELSHLLYQAVLSDNRIDARRAGQVFDVDAEAAWHAKGCFQVTLVGP